MANETTSNHFGVVHRDSTRSIVRGKRAINYEKSLSETIQSWVVESQLKFQFMLQFQRQQ